jgi:probable rRNA maturation factor
MMYEIDVATRCDCSVDTDVIRKAIMHGLQHEGVESAVLSVSIVDNKTIHELNRRHLEHDYPTDVISFQLDWSSPDHAEPPVTASGRSKGASIEGEVVVSVEYAAEMAPRCGWSTENELTLYAVHGMLHICGYDDLTQSEKEIMRARELSVLSGLGLRPQYPDLSDPDQPTDDDPPSEGQR